MTDECGISSGQTEFKLFVPEQQQHGEKWNQTSKNSNSRENDSKSPLVSSLHSWKPFAVQETSPKREKLNEEIKKHS